MFIFDKFGDGKAERNRTVLVCPATVAMDDVGLLHSRGLIPSALRLQRPRNVSNRELDLLGRRLSHCKQRTATVSNRELSTVRTLAAPSALTRDRIAISLRETRSAGRGTRSPAPFLTGSAPQTEFVVTHSKQTTVEFLTGARTAIKDAQFRAEFRTELQARRKKESRSRDAAEQGKIPLNIGIEKELL